MFTTSLPLLERLRDPQDRLAWLELLSLYTPLLRSWLRPHCRQEADLDDLTQEVLDVLARKVKDFDHNRRMGELFAPGCGSHRRQRAGPLPPHSATTRFVSPATQPGLVEQLEEITSSSLSRRWERQHDQHVAASLMALIRPEFADSTWEAFRRLVVEGRSTCRSRLRLGTSTANAVMIAKSPRPGPAPRRTKELGGKLTRARVFLKGSAFVGNGSCESGSLWCSA